ncbi:MAG TPA: ABC transporter permease [Phycisphaerae bacterium]|nr:ABC transporter permease [Phycisphaerae bacterium]
MSGLPVETPALNRKKHRFPAVQEMGLIVVIVLLSLFLWRASRPVNLTLLPKNVNGVMMPFRQVQENGFLRTSNIVNSVLTVMSWMAIMAIGETIVIISGGIDISVGSIMGLSSFVTALALLKLPADAAAPLVLLVGIGTALGVGLLCGLVNGITVVGLRMHPFIVTLATLSIFRWISLKLGVAYGASQPFGDTPLPAAFTDHFVACELKYSRYGGQMIESLGVVPIFVMLFCLTAGWVYLRHTVWGRQTYAVGGNEEAARFSGIRLPWVKLRVYALSGLCAGVAGMLNCGFYKSAATDTGKGYELAVIAAAVVGGASLTGGRGTALGAVLGMLVLQLIEDGIFVVGHLNLGFTKIEVVKEDTQLILGVAIVLAVAVDQLSTYLQARRAARVKAVAA